MDTNMEKQEKAMEIEGKPISHFDQEAATWDDDPVRRRRTEEIARGIVQAVPLSPDWRVLEYGCETASLGFLLAPHVREVVAADASAAMIEQVRRKVAVHPTARMKPLVLDLSRDPVPAERFNLIVTAMVLHHIDDTERLFSQFSEMLANDGWLAVADLCEEDGSFHAPMKVAHNGFSPECMGHTTGRILKTATCRWQINGHVQKNGRSYDVFLLTAHRSDKA